MASEIVLQNYVNMYKIVVNVSVVHDPDYITTFKCYSMVVMARLHYLHCW